MSIDFRQIFEASPDVLLVLLPDAPRFTMVAATEARLAATHTTREHTIGRPLFEVFPDNPDDPSATGTSNLRASLNRVLETRAPDTMALQRYDIRGSDGRFEVKYWSPKNVPVLGPTGDVLFILHRVEDVTELVQATELTETLRGKAQSMERELEHAREQKKLQDQLVISDRMASMGTLAAGVAHEINNPLASVIANVELAANVLRRIEKVGLMPELAELRDELHDAHAGAVRIRTIVKDLKIFSRSQEETLGPVDVVRLLESTLRMATNEIRHRARLVKDFQKTPPVQASESRLGQVFLNLVVNAAQAIEEGHADENEIRVSTSTEASGRVVIEISDTGSGMPAEVLERLFTPFFTTKAVGVGTGLGLSICHRIVTSFGGNIEVHSTLGKGTTFRVLLPVASQAVSAAKSEARVEGPAQKRGRVLVVDDEPMIARLVQRTLANEHEIVVSERAAEALERIHSGERFDVILCDVMMPQMTGIELHAELCKVERVQAERMVFLTGGTFTAAAREFLEKVANPTVEKPFDTQHLKALINERIK